MKRKHPAINKITPPDLPEVIQRQRLFDLLDHKQHYRITWISGKAGSGKTTLAASYIRARKLPCLWYRIDEGDNDLSTFFYYLRLAAKKASPRRRKPLQLFTPEYFLGAAVFARRFFENLATRLVPPFVIIFDDYQKIVRSSLFHEVLKNGLAMIPDSLQVIVSSRMNPPAAFSAMVANKQVRLIDSKDLRMRLDETHRILRVDSGPTLSRKVIRQIHEATGGWAAGLILMSKSVRRDTAEVLHAGTSIPFELFDYFAGELFDKLDDSTREFLLKTAFLPQFTADMAQKLTGRTDAEQLLAGLQRDNVFIEKILNEAPTYQYHALFRKFLADRATTDLDENSVPGLKRKGAILLEASGRVEEAVILFAEAGDAANLTRVIMENAARLILLGRSRTLVQWIERLSEEVWHNTPWLRYWLGVGNLSFSPADAQVHFEKAFYRFSQCRDSAGTYFAWAGVIDAIANSWNDFTLFDPWIEWLENELRGHRGPPAGEVETKVTVCMMTALLIRKPEHPDLAQWIERGLALSRKNGDIHLHVQAVNWAMTYYAWIGEFGKAEILRDESRAMIKSYRAAPAMTIYWKWLDVSTRLSTMTHIDTILEEIADAFDLIRHNGLYAWEHIFLMPGIFASLLLGRFSSADRFLKRFEAILDNTHFHGYAIFHHFAGLHHLLAGNSALALAHAETAVNLSLESGYVLSTLVCRIQLAFVLHGQGRTDDALEALTEARDQALAVKSHICEFMCLMVRAKIALDEDSCNGLECLRKALALGRQRGYLNMIWWWQPEMFLQLCEQALLAGIETEYVRQLIQVHKLVPASAAGRIESWPWAVKVYSLGRFQVQINGASLRFKGRPPKKPLELLQAMIAFGGAGVPVESIIDALWFDSDGDMAHSAFSTALNRLRKLLNAKDAVQLKNGKVTLDSKICWVDSLVFSQMFDAGYAQWNTGDKKQAFLSYEKAVSYYKGHFLAGEPGTSWVISARERLKNKYLAGITKLGMLLEQAGEAEKAMEYYEAGLDVDPLVESLYQHLIRCQLHLGRHADAARTYQRCRSNFSAALNVEPSAETEEIYKQIRN
jgi:DNA-binding SARP family transcriptional activator